MSRYARRGGPETGRNRHSVPARSLAVLGVVLTGLPLAAPLLFVVVFAGLGRGLHLDYLMPGELFPLVAVGTAALVGAALIARWRRMIVVVGFGVTVLAFALVVVLAIATGLASGRTAAAGWPLALVAGMYVLYALAVAGMFVLGVLLCRALFAREPPAPDIPATHVR